MDCWSAVSMSTAASINLQLFDIEGYFNHGLMLKETRQKITKPSFFVFLGGV